MTIFNRAVVASAVLQKVLSVTDYLGLSLPPNLQNTFTPKLGKVDSVIF